MQKIYEYEKKGRKTKKGKKCIVTILALQ